MRKKFKKSLPADWVKSGTRKVHHEKKEKKFFATEPDFILDKDQVPGISRSSLTDILARNATETYGNND